MEATVELDIFSGRPNPRWELSAREALVFRTLVLELPRGAAPSATGLGFRGFVVRVRDDAGRVEEYGVAPGAVTSNDGSFSDSAGSVVRWLAATAPPGFAGLVAQFVRDS